VTYIGESLSSLGATDEGHNVRVVLLHEHLLGRAGVMLYGADTDDLTLSQVRELQLGSESVPAVTRGVTEAKFIGVFVELMELGNTCDNIEISGDFLDVVEGFSLVHGDTLVLGEVLRGPLANAGEEGDFMFLPGVSLSGVCDGLVFTSGTSEGGVLIC